MILSDFITKWQPILTTWTGAVEDPQFAEDCRALGFEMDCGNSFSEAYPDKDVFRAHILREIIESIDDNKLLGTAIFSHWRYLTHWHNAPLPDDTIEWFSIAFDRLRVLSNTGNIEHKRGNDD